MGRTGAWSKQRLCTIGGGRQIELGKKKQKKSVRSIRNAEHVVVKQRRARYVRRAERTDRDELAVAVGNQTATGE
jgi:hypothetical protein